MTAGAHWTLRYEWLFLYFSPNYLFSIFNQHLYGKSFVLSLGALG